MSYRHTFGDPKSLKNENPKFSEGNPMTKWLEKIALVLKRQADHFTDDQKYEAQGIVKAGNGKIETDIVLSGNEKKPLLAMALCYAVKIKWLILTEQPMTERTFINVFGNTLNEWPQVPYVEMLSSIRENVSTFDVRVYYGRSKGWYVNNTLPDQYYSGDIATNYFILLKAILSELNHNERNILGNLLKEFKDDLLGMSKKDKSHKGLARILQKANKLLQTI